MRGLSTFLFVLLAGGCGGAGYRVVSSVHDVELTERMSIAVTSAPAGGAVVALAALDEGLARGLAVAAPSHRFEHGAGDAPFTLGVELSSLVSLDGSTRLASEVTIVDGGGALVDELEIAFDHPGTESAAGEELGRRIGHYLSHREGYHL